MFELDASFMNLIRPKVGLEMCRLGDTHDGGYVLPIIAVRNSRFLLSLGYGHNWKFERDFLASNRRIRGVIYDRDIRLILVAKQALRHLLLKLIRRHSRPLIWIKALARYIQLIFAFRLKYVISEVVPSKALEGQTVFKSLLGKQAIDGPLTLKMDIEGGEYACLESLSGNFESIECLIVEFHEINTQYERFQKLFNLISSKMYLVNTHFNNHSEVVSGRPDSIELTFLNKNCVLENELRLADQIPSPLDSPCNPNKLEISYVF